MIDARSFIDAARAEGFGLYTGVPCSYLKPLINHAIDDPAVRYVGATNEGDAVAMAAGAALGGLGAVVMFQNSGLGNAVNPLTSLNRIFELPVLIICTLRGEPGGKPDEPQHAVMGAITPALFDLMGIPWAYFPEEVAAIAPALAAARAEMAAGRPYALVMRDGAVAPQPLQTGAHPARAAAQPLPAHAWGSPAFSRRSALEAIQRAARPGDVLVATTGFTGRTLYAIDDRDNQLYMVGSMGCASSFALGLALARPERRVVCIDGDGAALMRLGAMATLGFERPANLVHVLLDNEAYDSTGGQSTVASDVDFANLARACGYPAVSRAVSLDDLESAVTGAQGLTFIHAKIGPDPKGDLPRPTMTPAAVAKRLQAWLNAAAPVTQPV
jgi:phosphonopyruvate decarboxylase